MTDVRHRVRRPGPWVAAALVASVLVAALLALVPGDRKPATLPPPPPPFLPPAPSAVAVLPATSAPAAVSPVPRSQTPTPKPTTVRPAAPSRPRPTTSRPRPEPAVTGRYRVVQSFDDGFIGEVFVANPTGRDRDWTVRLRFAGNVGNLRASWVESAPQATLATDGSTYVWTSGVPVPAGSGVALRFHFARSGSGDRPRTCTVDGTACTGV
jgi:hypothetical protein